MSSPAGSPTPRDIEAELERNRAELAATIDELTYRLDPRVKANEAVGRAKQMLHDAGTDPATAPEARNRARVVLGVAAAAVLGLVVAVARKD
ncbi:DUF3618 domain-containing protein [Cellulomonas fimi]|uniref:DUF3618 domain-containing protein n=1 Tax=Cellulomonas fimi TaxID=1708 RepID=A0A7Y0QGY6_CELFI|nr:DUF3618 domain-containing protein [Cellulomonas fimi]NMR19710.1 DUF3618 domain-containing protein [Cellulomonas fimi]